jgi:thiamine-phosphate pyrophosphorylase
MLFFTDPVRTPDPAAVLARLPRGAALVYRAFGAADAVARGRALTALARRRGVMVFAGADPGLAARIGAQGLHLPERMVRRAGQVRRLSRRFRLTAAAHGAPALALARRAGVEAAVLSAVFPSASPSAGRPLGLRRFDALARGAGLAVYALGGVDAMSARQLRGSRAAGLASVSAIAQVGAAGAAAANART